MNSLHVKQVLQRQRVLVPTPRLLFVYFGCRISQKFISETMNYKEKQKLTRPVAIMVLCWNETKKQTIITVILCQSRVLGFTLCILAWMKPSPGRVVLLIHGSSKFTVNLISSAQSAPQLQRSASSTHLCRYAAVSQAGIQVNIAGALSSLTLSCVSPDTIYAALKTVVMAKSHMAKRFGNL